MDVACNGCRARFMTLSCNAGVLALTKGGIVYVRKGPRRTERPSKIAQAQGARVPRYLGRGSSAKAAGGARSAPTGGGKGGVLCRGQDTAAA